MSTIAIIFDPQRADKYVAPASFYYPKSAALIDRKRPLPQGAGNPQDLEYGQVILIPNNTNLIEKKDWDAVCAHEPNKVHIQRMTGRGALRVFDPGKPEEELTGYTMDFDEMDAIEIIEKSSDIEWLRVCAIREDKRRKVAKACTDRVTQIEEEKKRKNQVQQAMVM